MTYFVRATFAAALLATTFTAAPAAAQQSMFFGCDAIPLAGICIGIDPQGNRITYDLQTRQIIKIEPSRLNDITGTVPAPGRIQRAPIDTPFPEDNSREQFIQQNERLTAPTIVETQPENQVQTAAITKPENLGGKISVDVAELQVLLDRLGISPGVIDGQKGSNVAKAIASYSARSGRDLSSLTAQELTSELSSTGGDPFIRYSITPEDLAGPFVATIPADYSEKAKLPAMAYTSALEALAEKFHMDENYLKTLNPGVDFARPGTMIKVANVGTPVKTEIARIEADKSAEQVRAYDAAGNLVTAYPATIGSAATPSPSGTVTIERFAINPNYTYNPKINFTQGENRSILTIPPGPNGPVGSVWMALSKPTYGIHGTPNPARIGKTNSHGCIRLTNWDAKELAGMASIGVTVEFLD